MSYFLDEVGRYLGTAASLLHRSCRMEETGQNRLMVASSTERAKTFSGIVNCCCQCCDQLSSFHLERHQEGGPGAHNAEGTDRDYS